MVKLTVTYIEPSALKRRGSNPRVHSAKQIAQIAKSMVEFGFLNPILIDDENQIIAGHGRVDAAQMQGIDRVPVVRVDHLTPAQIRAYVIADNRIAANAGWNEELLALELQELEDLDFDFEMLGFEPAEIDLLLTESSSSAKLDTVPAPTTSSPVSRLGDLWHIGTHRLLCGNALEEADLGKVLDGEKASCIFTDPPYGVPINGHVSGKGKIRHREFVMASGEMSSEEFAQFLETALGNLTAHSENGSIHFVCMDWRHIAELTSAGQKVYSELKNLCVWVKSNGGMGSLYRSRHELVFVFKNGMASHRNNVELGRFGRNRTNVWEYAGVNSFGKERGDELQMHPTVKPVAMIADALKDCSKRGDLILDSFAGSGSTLIAAQHTGRRSCGVELDPIYVDTILRRFEKVFGIKATLAENGMSLDEVSKSRSLESEPSPQSGIEPCTSTKKASRRRNHDMQPQPKKPDCVGHTASERELA